MSDRDRRYSYDRNHRHHHHRGYSRERDYSDREDSYRREKRRVPGLVTDPADRDRDRYSTIEGEIRRGQTESMERYKTDSYYSKEQGRSRITKDTMSAPPYNISSTQPYLPRSHKDSPPLYSPSASKKRRLPCNPSVLSFLGGFIGVAVVVAAIILSWYTRVTVNGTGISVTNLGLFSFCTREGGVITCGTIENYSSAGGNVFSDLEQATRGLIIISAIFGLVALCIDIFFALHKYERRRGAFYGGAAFLLAGCCGVAAMGCYSSVISSAIAATTDRSAAIPNISFYLGWFGTTLFLLSAFTSFLSNATSWSK
uniref:Uncharacterized protein LOC100175766 n=1 Tax=Phallusia mammillata TaxID=59560 RepID=A0A6F9DFT0_9ASCI|nr:uncharacterized protein LOC100175766 [Phallusia mammillata]